MAEDTATLRDTVVSDEPVATTGQEATPADKPTEIKITEAPDPQAAEIGQLLMDSGYTKDQLNDLIESPRALASLRDMIQNNPREFLNSLFRSDSTLGERFLEDAGSLYIERYGNKATPPKSGDKPDSKTDDLMREVELLREETRQLKTEQQRRDEASAMAQARARYDARVDDMFGLKEVKDLGLSKSEQKNMRSRLSTELSQDPSVVKRVSNGNFVDVPKAFQSLLQEKVDERKAATEAEKEKRENSQKGSFSEFFQGPNPFMADLKSNPNMFDSWDNTEAAFAKALDSTR